jgi:predicted metal-dependent phosphotriesterase family hydrolase
MGSRLIMTVTGPIAPADLGPTDAHDHLFLRSPAQPEDTLDDLGKAVAELEEGQASGLRAVVDLTPIGLGRRPQLLRDAARRTGISIIGATGYHRDAHYSAGDWVLKAGVEELASKVVADLREGMEGTDVKAGVIKGGASLNGPSDQEACRLRAIAAASLATSAAVVVHTEAGTGGPHVVDMLTNEGLAAERITLAHMDRNPDRDLHTKLLARGINLVYDTIGRDKYGPDRARVDLIADMVDAGFGNQLMLGLDLGRRVYHRAYGGEPGLRHLMATFVPQLRRRVGDAAVDAMLVTNPARIYSMPA